MMFILWPLTGGIVGMANALTLRWTVARLHPDMPRRAVAWTIGGLILRWILVAGLLIAALQYGIASALLAFTGLWLTRWGTVWWLNRRVIL
jgi:hypothetical protein